MLRILSKHDIKYCKCQVFFINKKTRLVYLFIFIALNIYCQPNSKFKFQASKMGTLIQVTIADQDSITASRAAQEVFQLYDTLNQILSDYLPNSEVNQLCQKAGNGEWTSVSAHLLNILTLSLQAYDLSNGAFNPSVGSLVQLWRKARKNQVFPNEKELSEAFSTVGFELGKDIEVNGNQVRLNKKGVQLDFGGIAKGYAAQCALGNLKSKGIKAVLIDSGGDLIIGDAPYDTNGWNIAINNPDELNKTLPFITKLINCSVATSGSLYQSMEIAGKNYSHILDPETGIGLTHQRNVTVIANNGATADWLATACSVLPVSKAKKLIRRINKNVEKTASQAKLLITFRRKGKIKTRKAGDFKWISLN